MKKKLTEKVVYEPNSRIKITVDNKPSEVDGVTEYKRTVTIKVNAGTDREKLTFSTDDDIAKWVENLDFEEPQTALELEPLAKGKN